MKDSVKTNIEQKSYDEPKLIELGTLTELTHGAQSGVDDPISGGSGPAFLPPWTPKDD